MRGYTSLLRHTAGGHSPTHCGILFNGTIVTVQWHHSNTAFTMETLHIHEVLLSFTYNSDSWPYTGRIYDVWV